MKTTSPEIDGATAPQTVTETKFMQNYRVSSPVNGGAEVAAVRNSSGDVELFTIGSDGTVWNFYPDPTSDTGYSGVSMGVQGTTVSAGVDNNGDIVVFAGSGLQLFYVVEIDSATSRWSTPVAVQLPLPPAATRVARVMAQEIAGQLYVGVLTKYTSAIGAIYSVAVSTWQTNAPEFERTTMNLSSVNCAWLGNSAQSAAFACVDGIIVAYVVATGQITRYPMAAPFQALSVDSIPDSTGNDQVWAVLADGNAYHLVSGGNNQPYSWVQMSQGMTFRQLLVDKDGNGNVQIFAVSGNNGLYHWEPLSSSPTGYSYPPNNIFQNAVLLGLAGNDAGDIDLFVVGTAQSTLTHLFQEEASTNWQAERVEVPTGGQVEEYTSYTSDMTVRDAAGAPLVNTPVSVWASEETRVTVNGATYFVDANHPARTTTNSAGMLSLAQETGTLAIPALQLNFPAVMSPGSSIALRQADVVQNRLATLQGTDLMAAKDVEGNYLLADQYRNTDTTNSLASAFNKCMNLAGTPPPNAVPLMTRHGLKPGLYLRPSGSAAHLGRIAQPSVEQHWQLSFDGHKVSYRDLTMTEAAALLTEKRASFQSAFGIFDWLDDVGDFLEGVADGVISIVDTIVTTVADGVQAAFTFIVDGVTYLYEAVVTFVEQAFDIVEAFFAQVKVFFEKIFEWLGLLFSWPDILRTHEVLVYAVNQFLGFVQGSAAGIQTIVDNGITNLQSQIATLFDYAVQNIAGTSSLGGYEQANQQSNPQFDSAVSNNIVYNNFIDNSGSASSTSPLAAALADSDPLSQLLQQLQTFATNTQSGSAFASAQTYFQNLGGSPDQIFSQLLAGLLRVVEGVLQAVISGLKVLVDSLLQLAQTIVAALQALLNEEWDIPFVSEFYSWITDGSDLTTLDLVALIVAVPVTIFYKLLNGGSAPFPNEGSVTAFTSSFTAQTMLNAAGFGPTGPKAQRTAAKAKTIALDKEPWTGLLSKEDATLMAIFGAISTFFYGAVTAINDFVPKEAPKALSYAAWILEGAAQICGFPWWYSSGATSCDQNNADGCGRTLWIYQNVGVLMDGVFLKLEGRLPENANDAGIVVQFIYSLIHLDLAILASEATSGVPVAANILPVIPELSKLLRLTVVQEVTEGISLPVMAGVDFIFYTASAIVGFVAENSIINNSSDAAVVAVPST
jgi:hypothetical protein